MLRLIMMTCILQVGFSAVVVPINKGGTVNVGPVQQDGCPCTYKSVWLDVMVIVEASKATTAKGMDEMFGYVQTNLEWLTVQKTASEIKMSTQVGIVTYGTNNTLVAPLGSIDNAELDNVELPFYESHGTVDLEGALGTAISELSSSRHRQNTRKVIVLMASTYNPLASPMPAQLIKAFQNAQGIVIVYNYVQTHGLPSASLPDLASPGFFMTNLNETKATALNDNLCLANCFCSVDFVSFSKQVPFGFPSEDCYIALPKPSTYSLAENTCDSLNGYVAMANNHEKSAFLRDQWNSTEEIWAGLNGSPSKGFTFVDQTPLNYYRPWRNSDFENDQPCVSMGFDLFWKGESCSAEKHFACQARPCSSVKYCELDPHQT